MKLLGAAALWLVALIILALLSWGLTLYMAWPLWIGAAVFFGVIGLYFLVKFVRRMWIVMRSRSKLAQLSSTGPASITQQATPEAMLTRKWKTAIATLRGSSLKRLGNPLYVLPWYMVIGRSGTGKTTALTRARLSSPIQKVSQSARVEQTVNYDWWYFDQAVVIDCAGRYVDAQDIEQDRREWELGLDLLARYRPKEGLDGLVLAISTDRLAHPDKDALIEEGRVVRARIEQLIQMFGKRFPIYVLITKCDQLYGLEEWAKLLPENALEQAMGYLSEEIEPGGESKFVDDAFASIGERLQKLRIALVARSTTVLPELLMFPNELDNLKSKLDMFLHACMADNPYMERPFLRGLFFSSGLQEGGAVSQLLGQVLPPVPSHPSTNAGLFLHDFFGRVLPRDRYISRPAQLINHWRRVTQNIGLMAWLLLSLAIGIVITVSFFGNLETLSLVRDAHPYNPVLTGRIEDDVPTLAQVNDSLIAVERSNQSWKNQWVVISGNLNVLEGRLTQQFVRNVRQFVVPIADRNEQEDFDRTQLSDDHHELPDLIRNVVRQINLAQARMHGADRTTLLAMHQPAHTTRYALQFDQQLNQLNISHLAWSAVSDPYLSDRVHLDQATLNRVAYADPQMSWLVGLTPDSGPIAPVVANDFWNSSVLSDATKSAQNETGVPGAYTKAGKQAIEDFLDEMQKSVDNQSAFLVHRAAFESWYRDQRILAWQNFLINFSGAEDSLAGETQWRAALSAITGTQSPYYRLIDRLTDEFADYGDQELPSWLLLARDFQQLRSQATRLGAANQAVKVVGALNSVGGKAVRETLGGSPAQGSRTVKNNLTAVDTLSQYFSDVNKLAADSVTGSAKDYQIAADFHQFANDPAAKASAVQSAAQKLVLLKKLLGYENVSDQAVWRLIGGPLNFTLIYVEQQASCELQKNWQANVLWSLQGATDKAAMLDQLYGAKGSVWAFADGPAKPFLIRDAKHFAIVDTLGYSMPFTNEFLPMLNGAVNQRVKQLVSQQRQDTDKQNAQLQAQQDQLQNQLAQAQLESALAAAKQKAEAAQSTPIQVTITAQPTSINPGAKAKPFATLLTIQCAAGAQAINNYNFPVSSSFAWAPSQCGEVSLQIKIDTLVLTKKYPGPLGVARFMRDFHSGVHQFENSDFASASTALDALGVRQIGVHYNFDGLEAVLNAAQLIDDYDKLQKDSALEKQRLQEAQLMQSQQSLQQKMVPLPEPLSVPDTTGVTVAQQIGVCWNQNNMRSKPQDIATLISQLVNQADAGTKPVQPVQPVRPPLPMSLPLKR